MGLVLGVALVDGNFGCLQAPDARRRQMNWPRARSDPGFSAPNRANARPDAGKSRENTVDETVVGSRSYTRDFPHKRLWRLGHGITLGNGRPSAWSPDRGRLVTRSRTLGHGITSACPGVDGNLRTAHARNGPLCTRHFVERRRTMVLHRFPALRKQPTPTCVGTSNVPPWIRIRHVHWCRHRAGVGTFDSAAADPGSARAVVLPPTRSRRV